MNSIEARFNEIQKENPEYSSYTCFALAIGGRHYTGRTISFWFRSLVDKEDYSSEDKNAILKFLRTL